MAAYTCSDLDADKKLLVDRFAEVLGPHDIYADAPGFLDQAPPIVHEFVDRCGAAWVTEIANNITGRTFRGILGMVEAYVGLPTPTTAPPQPGSAAKRGALTNAGVGELRFGDSVERARDLFAGSKETHPCDPSITSMMVGSLMLVFWDERFVHFGLSDDQEWSSPSGINIGMDEAEVRRLVPTATEKFGPYDRTNLVVGDGDNVIQFDVTDGSVSKISGGKRSAAGNPAC